MTAIYAVMFVMSAVLIYPSKGFGAVRPRKIAFPIDIVLRPYNSVGTTVLHCDKWTLSYYDDDGDGDGDGDDDDDVFFFFL